MVYATAGGCSKRTAPVIKVTCVAGAVGVSLALDEKDSAEEMTQAAIELARTRGRPHPNPPPEGEGILPGLTCAAPPEALRFSPLYARPC